MEAEMLVDVANEGKSKELQNRECFKSVLDLLIVKGANGIFKPEEDEKILEEVNGKTREKKHLD